MRGKAAWLQRLLTRSRPAAPVEQRPGSRSSEAQPGEPSVEAIVAAALGRTSTLDRVRTELARARAAGELYGAIEHAREILVLRPHDLQARTLVGELTAELRSRDVENLCRLALLQAAANELEPAHKVARAAERLDPRHPSCVQLRGYLDREREP